jgi:hypothetical protein
MTKRPLLLWNIFFFLFYFCCQPNQVFWVTLSFSLSVFKSEEDEDG